MGRGPASVNDDEVYDAQSSAPSSPQGGPLGASAQPAVQTLLLATALPSLTPAQQPAAGGWWGRSAILNKFSDATPLQPMRGVSPGLAAAVASASKSLNQQQVEHQHQQHRALYQPGELAGAAASMKAKDHTSRLMMRMMMIGFPGGSSWRRRGHANPRFCN